MGLSPLAPQKFISDWFCVFNFRSLEEKEKGEQREGRRIGRV